MGKRHFKHLYVPEHWERYWSKYPEGYTILEALVNWVSQVDDMVDQLNKNTDNIDNFIEDMDKKFSEFLDRFEHNLRKEVKKYLDDWVESNNIIQEILDIIFDSYVYNFANVKKMIDFKPIKGTFCRTLGYYNEGDGGGALYEVVSEDNNINIPLSDGLYAKNISATKNVCMYGADATGLVDSTSAFKKGLQDTNTLIVNQGKYIVNDQLVVGVNKFLRGETKNVRGEDNSSTIKYVGEKNRYKAVIRLGSNDVNDVPTKSSSNVQLKNIRVDANKLAGFGVYGTYITGESEVVNVVAKNALEYGQYYARSWYLKLHDLVSLNSDYNGIAIGMPLRYSDGKCISDIQWEGSSTEMNMVDIQNLRSSRSGEIYKDKLWNKGNIADLIGGYGVGIGVGNGITPSNIVSETSGGANLVCYTESQPLKKIRNCYLENTNAFIDGNVNKTGLLVYFSKNKRGDTGGPIFIDDVFINPENGGKVILSGASGRDVYLRNIQQPVGLDTYDYDTGDKDKFYCARVRNFHNRTYSKNPNDMIEVIRKEINTGWQWEDIHFPLKTDTIQIYGRLLSDAVTPIDYLSYVDRNGTRVDIPLSNLSGTSFEFLGQVPWGTEKVFRGGETSTDDKNEVELVFMKTIVR